MTKTISVAGGNWGLNGTWKEGSPPGPSEMVVGASDSGSLFVDTNTCGGLDLSKYKASSAVWVSTVLIVNGNATLGGAGVILGVNTGFVISNGTLRSNYKLTSNPGSYVQFSGTYPTPTYLGDALNVEYADVLATGGWFHTNGYSIVCNSFRAIVGANYDLGSSFITVTGNDTTTGGSYVWSDYEGVPNPPSTSHIISLQMSGNATMMLTQNDYGEINNLGNIDDTNLLYIDYDTTMSSHYDIRKFYMSFDGVGTKPIYFMDTNVANPGSIWHFDEFNVYGNNGGWISLNEAYI